MAEDKLLLRQHDRDRLKVLHEVKKGHITQRVAAGQLKLSERWIRELVERMRQKGDRAVMHGLRGRPSRHRLAGKMEKQAVEIIRREYADFGPTLASEYLQRDQRIRASRETVRQRMMRAGLWKRRKQRMAEVHVWRKRRSCFGELVQWDTSDHDWLEGRGQRMYLIGMLDDASSRGLARFAPQDIQQPRTCACSGAGWISMVALWTPTQIEQGGLKPTGPISAMPSGMANCRKLRSGARSESWGSAGSRRDPPKQKGGSRDSLRLRKTAW
jgi:hypothetical protein